MYKSVCVTPSLFCAVLPTSGQTAFGELEKQRLHGQVQNLAFSPKPSCRPDNVAHMRRNLWLPVKAGSSNGVITVRDNAERCTFFSASSSLSALYVAQHCPLLPTAFTTLDSVEPEDLHCRNDHKTVKQSES